MQVEKPALLRLVAEDRTSVLIDGRTEIDPKPRLRNAVSMPLRDASKAKDDGRFVVGSNGAEARLVAEAIVREALHNVTFSMARLRICRSWSRRTIDHCIGGGGGH